MAFISFHIRDNRLSNDYRFIQSVTTVTMVNLGKGNKRRARGSGAGGSRVHHRAVTQTPLPSEAAKSSLSHHSTGTPDSFVEVGCELMCASCLHCSVFQHRDRMEMCLPGKSCFQPTRQRAQHAAQPGHLQLTTEASAFLGTRAV